MKFLFLLASSVLANSLREKHNQPKCETMTITHVTSETLIYPSTLITTQTLTDHSAAKKTVTVTEVVTGGTLTITEGGAASSTVTVISTSVVKVSQGTKTVTSFIFPYATTTVIETTTETVTADFLTTITYPPLAIPIESFSNLYTGAPTSLFLSVI